MQLKEVLENFGLRIGQKMTYNSLPLIYAGKLIYFYNIFHKNRNLEGWKCVNTRLFNENKLVINLIIIYQVFTKTMIFLNIIHI